jgi:hypothetical protein
MSAKPEKPRRLVHFTPLRYPGGKAKLAAYVKEIIRQNKLYDGEYAEPYAGGAGIALELLFQEYVQQVRINDVSHHVYSFWKSVLNDTDELCRLVKNTRLSVAAWDRQKKGLLKSGRPRLHKSWICHVLSKPNQQVRHIERRHYWRTRSDWALEDRCAL